MVRGMTHSWGKKAIVERIDSVMSTAWTVRGDGADGQGPF
jgi:hypothetical protein